MRVLPQSEWEIPPQRTVESDYGKTLGGGRNSPVRTEVFWVVHDVFLDCVSVISGGGIHVFCDCFLFGISITGARQTKDCPRGKDYLWGIPSNCKHELSSSLELSTKQINFIEKRSLPALFSKFGEATFSSLGCRLKTILAPIDSLSP